jgi:hypothetical protein
MPVDRSTRVKLADGAPPLLAAAAGAEPAAIAATVNARVSRNVVERREFMTVPLIAVINWVKSDM